MKEGVGVSGINEGVAEHMSSVSQYQLSHSSILGPEPWTERQGHALIPLGILECLVEGRFSRRASKIENSMPSGQGSACWVILQEMSQV